MTTSSSPLYWLGGAPCSGKSTLSDRLADQFGLRLYHVDEAFEAHIPHLDPARYPARYPALNRWFRASWDERWMQPPEALLHDGLACYEEQFSLVCADLQALPPGPPVLVEGTSLLPGLVAPLGAEPGSALWLVPTPEFQRTHYAQRPWIRGVLAGCTDPEAAFNNWMDRDARFAAWLTGAAQALGFTALSVDGQASLEENARRVAEHFGLFAAV